MWDNVSAEAKDLIKKLLVVDPLQRLTAEQALKHAWVLTKDEVLVKRDLTGTVEEMKKFNAKRKFRGAVAAVKLMNRLKASGSARLDDPTDGEADIDGSESAKPVVFQPATGNILATNVVGTA
eukprot:evm.model.NODE_37459_length_27832_cov_24.884413.11